MSTETALRERALAAFEARRRREDADYQARAQATIDALRERAGETLYESLEIRTEPTAWALADVDRIYQDGHGTAVIEESGVRFAYHDRPGGYGGPVVELTAQDRCRACGSWYDVTTISPTGYPAIEQLGRYYAALEENDQDHPVCPATSRCADESCLRPEAHYGHAPNVDAAETAPEYPEATTPGKEAEPREAGPDEKLGAALREWLTANATGQAYAIGVALHNEIEQALGAGDGG